MTNKKILNITSTKKRDTMMTYTNTRSGQDHGSPTYINGAATLDGAHDYSFLWMPTARESNHFDDSDLAKSDDAVRTANVCYMRGLKERIHIQTSSGIPWNWRRICFTMKGDYLYKNNESSYNVNALTSNGYARVVNSFETSNLGANLLTLLFKGTEGADWNSRYSATVDNTRVSVKFDKTWLIQSGNDSGVLRQMNLWHPMNKNIHYDTEEVGDKTISTSWSVDSRQGMGDYYIVDLIRAGTGGTTSDFFTFQPEATLYWHEK